VQGGGEVVWSRDRYLGPGQPAGIGIRFTQLDTQSRDHIAEALFEFLEQSLSEEMLSDTDHMASEMGVAPEEVEGLPASWLARDAQVDASLAALAPPPPAAEPPPALDLTALAPLPPAAEVPAALEERGSFAVFSSLEQADPQTREILREALKEESPYEIAGAAEARIRGRSPLPWLLVAFLVVAAGYFAWQRWGAEWLPRQVAAAPAEAAQPQPRAPEPLPAVATDKTLAETVGIDPSRPSPAARPALAGESAPPAEPPEVAPEQAAATPPATAEPPAANLPRARKLLGSEAGSAGSCL
jgi:hypothetical protein